MTTLRQGLARTFRGFTWRRFALLCGIVAIAASGHGVVTFLRTGKTVGDALAAYAWQYASLFLFFGAVWTAVVAAANWAPARTAPRIATLALAVVGGIVAGTLLSGPLTAWVHDKDAPTLLKEISAIVLWSHVIAAGVLGWFFFVREEESAARLHQEDMRRERETRELAEARLMVMQAQVEPHFLFNTLAHVRRLFKTDPPAAQAMLAHLARYLGAMLPQMRKADATLAHELSLALAYLSVQKIRMGPRLAVHTDVPDALGALDFPPMMLVTLVENAIRHGLNPLPDGGRVRIQARAGDGKLRVQVADSGAGLSESSGAGVGLANVRARLTTLYGGNARFLLAQNPHGGVTATIELPLQAAAASEQAA
jgi:signal transduction histidine kinase